MTAEDENEKERRGSADDLRAGELDGANKGDTPSADDMGKPSTVASQAAKTAELTNVREDGTPYPTGIKLAVITIALSLTVFLMALGMCDPALVFSWQP